MYEKYLKYYPGFPLKGVNFVDILPLMHDRSVFRSVIRDLGALCGSPNVVAPEARGFLFAAPMLTECSNIRNIIPMRKKGKLPFEKGDLVNVDIVKEYGKDTLYFRLSDVAAGRPDGDVFNVTFFDDVLATGGTAFGIARALEKVKVVKDGREYGIRVEDFVFLVELDDLKGRNKLGSIAPVKSLIHVNGTE